MAEPRAAGGIGRAHVAARTAIVVIGRRIDALRAAADLAAVRAGRARAAGADLIGRAAARAWTRASAGTAGASEAAVVAARAAIVGIGLTIGAQVVAAIGRGAGTGTKSRRAEGAGRAGMSARATIRWIHRQIGAASVGARKISTRAVDRQRVGSGIGRRSVGGRCIRHAAGAAGSTGTAAGRTGIVTAAKCQSTQR